MLGNFVASLGKGHIYRPSPTTVLETKVKKTANWKFFNLFSILYKS